MLTEKIITDLKRIKFIKSPHIVILGAGASIATSLHKSYVGKKLPAMKELPDILELNQILEKNEFKKAKIDFESFYDDVVKSKRIDLQQELQIRTEKYFNSIKIQNSVTLYDKLVLSLRPKDTIFSFNWDPLLPYAYRRNGFLKTLPALRFLHGNVLSGVCKKHSRIGWNDGKCTICNKTLKKTSLLFPIKKKNYDSDPIISEAWKLLDDKINNAYFITFFGYSAPKSDVIARKRIIEKLSTNSSLHIMELEIIDPNYDELLKTNYSILPQELHISKINNFDYCWLMSYPKLSCEALFEATMQNNPIQRYTQIETDDLKELQEWSKELDDFIPK